MRKLLLAAGTVGGIVLALWLVLRPSAPPGGENSGSVPQEPSEAAAAVEPPPASPEPSPPPVSESRPMISPARELSAALERGDKAGIQTALAKLAPELETEPERIAAVLAELKATSQDWLGALKLVAQANAARPTSGGDRLLTQWALELAASERSPEARQAAVLALTQPPPNPRGMNNPRTLPPDLLSGLARLSCEDESPQVRASAIEAMGSWVNWNPNCLPALSRALLGTKEKTDPWTWGLALKTITDHARQHMGLPDEVLGQMTDLLWKDSSAPNRELVVQAFTGASGSAIASALGQLEKAFYEQTEPDTRTVILGQIVRLGQGSAWQILSGIPEDDPLAAQARNYLESLQTR